MKWIKISFLICAILHLVYSSPFGAPLEACESMLPNHPPFVPRLDDPPIDIIVSKLFIFPNERINVTIRANPGFQFRGFLIQARPLSEDISIGRFFAADEVNTINCFGMIQSAVTHTSASDKSEIVFEWEAPDISDPLAFDFHVTIVERGDSFWMPKTSSILAVVPEPTTTDLPGDLDEIYEGCGDIKVCYGIPEGCIQTKNCDLFGAVTHDSGNFEFELLSIPFHNYVAFGLSQTQSMGEASVIDCVRTTTVPEAVASFASWNPSAGPNTRNSVPQTIIRPIESRFIDGRIYCRVERVALSTVNGFVFDLVNEPHHLLLAGGSDLWPDSVGPHWNNRGVTADRYWLADPPGGSPPPPGDVDWIYEGCGDTKVCFGVPDNCIASRDCRLFGGVTDNFGNFEFELLGLSGYNYIAFGLSQTPLMGDSSVVECVQQFPGIIMAFTSWNHARFNDRVGVPQNIIRTLETSFIDGRIYCKLERDTLSIVNGQVFDLRNHQHHLLVAGGLFFSLDAVGVHTMNNRNVSQEKYWLTDRPELPPEDPIYDGCGDTKLCFGKPHQCYLTRNCDMLATVYYNNGNFEFELLGQVSHNYIAFGLSQSQSMGTSSVIECVQETPGNVLAYTSWNEEGFSNNRNEVPQEIIRTLMTRFLNGRIYCKLERDTFTTVRGQPFDLRNEQHYLLIAGSVNLQVNNVGIHTPFDQALSGERVWLAGQPPPTTTTEEPTTTTLEPTTTTTQSPDDPIYDGCGTRKLCFGIPNLCHRTRDCRMLSTVFYNDGDFEFELLGQSNHNYVAFGLSQTSSMGTSSVIECVRGPLGNVLGFTSWNEEGFTNNRNNVPQTIIRTLETTFINGRIYCKLNRDTVSQVRGQTFHLQDEMHHLLLAGGIEVRENSVGAHLISDRAVSGNRYWLTDPREVQKAPLSALLLTHGSLMIVAWIGLTSIGVVMARYFKTSWSKRKIFGKDIWFVWHVLCMFLTWALTLIGFILIFVDVGQWSTTVHSVMGCVVLALVNLQAIGGAVRPGPKAKGRLLFNWMHKSFGNITHLLAVLTIFFAVPLPQARLPDYTTFILVGFVSYYLLMHVILTSVDVCSQMKRKKRLGVEINKNARFEVFKRTFLGFHIVAVTLFVIALVLIFTINPF